ncbi:unnamed protein product [Lasius platythorax]|uniref:Uncharacterized protein n=1 Tax=Lasius platythorax TaxID=488582 RepID=A0AAV2NX22_9HYME
MLDDRLFVVDCMEEIHVRSSSFLIGEKKANYRIQMCAEGRRENETIQIHGTPVSGRPRCSSGMRQVGRKVKDFARANTSATRT